MGAARPSVVAGALAMAVTGALAPTVGTAGTATVCGPASPYTNAVLATTGVVGYWRLGDSTATACDSTGTRNGQYRRTYTLGQPGLLVNDPDKSVLLDGATASVRVASLGALNPTWAISIEAWVSPTSVAVDQTVARKQGQYLLRLQGASLFFRMWWKDGTYTELTSPAVLQPGGSQHLVATYDGAAMRVYRNGTEVGSKPATKQAATTGNALLLGASDGYDYFGGRLDEVAIYSAAMPAVTVADHFAVGRGTDPAPPAAPTGLVATAQDQSVALDWADNPEPDLGSYRVYRRDPAGEWPTNPVLVTAESAATDSGLVNGTAYEYRVTAVDLGGNESLPSTPVSAVPQPGPPVPPTNLQALGGANAIGLRWTPPAPPPAEHRIYRQDGSGWPATPLASVPGTAASYVDSNGPSTATYRVTTVNSLGQESGPSPEASASWAPNVFLVAGDIAGCDTSGDEATVLLLDGQAGTVLTLGDHVYENGTAAEFADCYDPTWGRHKWRTRPAVGDHEYRTPGAAPYFSYFGAAAGDPATGYYSFEQAGWHIVVLNHNCDKIGGCNAGSPQEQWLRQVLAANTAQCTLAVLPGARFSSGTVHGSQWWMEPFWQAFYDHNVDLVLSANEHIYERFAPQTPQGVADPVRGIRQIIVGTGGRALYAIGPPIANSEVRNNDAFGVLRLELNPGGYSWLFLPEAGRTFTDSGSGTCH